MAYDAFCPWPRVQPDGTVSDPPAADETDAVKFVLAGGILWHALEKYGADTWYAIEPGGSSSSSTKYANARTPQEAVRLYIKSYGAPWEKPKDGL